MKILFIADYFFPHEVSGAEVSTRLLIRKIVQNKGIEAAVITSGFKGDQKEEIQDGIKVYHYPFGNQFSGRSFAPGKVTNPFFWLYSAWQIYKRSETFKPDILHVQGKNHLIGAFIANIFLKKKLIYTARDYRPLCDLGMCLSRGNKICSFNDYLSKDVPTYIKNFTDGSFLNSFKAFINALLNLPIRAIYKIILKNLPAIICISDAEEKIYQASGLSNTHTIYNTANISLVNSIRKKQINYGGRYSLGKGSAILDKVLPEFLNKHPGWEAIFIGADKPKWDHSQLKILGKIPYAQVVKIHSESAFAVVPSIWPEPFGRAALDPLAVGTPVICSNRGGLPEIIKDNRYGLVLEPTAENFSQGLEVGVKKFAQWQKLIESDEKKIKQKFSVDPISQHIELYKSLI